MKKKSPVSGTSNWSKKKLLVFSMISVSIVLLVLEIIFRIAFFFEYRHLHTTVAIQGSPLQQFDTALIFKNSPFYVNYHKKFQNNEEGMKSAVGDEFIGEKQADDYWVLLTGGSAMEGMGSNRNGEWLDISGVDDHPYEETIAYHLQQMLQAKMPAKRVKVFNAASSSYTIYQSRQRYLELAEKIKPDWVISMDGVNDPVSLPEGETSPQWSMREWQSRPQFGYPLRLVIPLTSHSALVNYVKQKIFDIRETGRYEKALRAGFPERKKWAATGAPEIKYAETDAGIERGIDNFIFWINDYDSTLSARGTKHLLLIQPYMSFRDTTNLSTEERALNHYYRSEFADSAKHTFFRSIYAQFPAADSLHSNIVSMGSVHHWHGWVFVDYCHFTNEALKRISEEIYNYIVSDGNRRIFMIADF
jgi:hypothetical protein